MSERNYRGHPRWPIAYRLLSEKEPGEIVTFEELGEVLELSPENRKDIGWSVRQASKKLEEDGKNGVDSVPRVGYKVRLKRSRKLTEYDLVQVQHVAEQGQRNAEELDALRARIERLEENIENLVNALNR